MAGENLSGLTRQQVQREMKGEAEFPGLRSACFLFGMVASLAGAAVLADEGSPRCGAVVERLFRGLERAEFRSAAEVFTYSRSIPDDEVEIRTAAMAVGLRVLTSELGYPSEWAFQKLASDGVRHELSLHSDLGQEFEGDPFYVYTGRFHHDGPVDFIFRFEQEEPRCELGSIFVAWPESESRARRGLQVITAIMEAQARFVEKLEQGLRTPH